VQEGKGNFCLFKGKKRKGRKYGFRGNRETPEFIEQGEGEKRAITLFCPKKEGTRRLETFLKRGRKVGY